MKLVPYSDSESGLWDEFVARSQMATFLHSRRYLAYHKDRFKDCSLLIKDEKENLAGLFLAAVDPGNPRRVISHPGITYGGVLHDGRLRGERMVEAFGALRDYYARQGFETLRYKAIPHIYHRAPSADDSYALFRVGAVRYRCDLSCAIDLANRQPPSERRRRGLKKALKNGVQISEGAQFIEPLWRVIEDNLARKYNLKPVHTSEEIKHLHSLFPQNIAFVVAQVGAEVVAGVTLYMTPNVVHAQYTASSAAGYECAALDAVFAHCIEEAKSRSARYFDFGNSNEDEGRYLNADLHQFKAEFGAGGMVHDFYEIDLAAHSAA